MQNGLFWVSAALLWFASASSHAEDALVTVLSATVKDQPIAGARVSLGRSIQPDLVATTEALGRALLDEHYLADSNTRIVIRREGYATFEAMCPCTGRTYALSPDQQGLDSIRIVLTWHGKASNLEGHLRYAANHVYYANKKAADASLDVDANNGHGPVTITIDRRRSGETYVYGVRYYGNMKDPRDQSALTESEATAFVYANSSLVRTFNVPRGQPGNLWTVFHITSAGAIEDINRITLSDPHSDDLLEDTLRESLLPPDTASTTDAQRVDAKALGNKADNAYRAGKLKEAIQLYEQAVALNPHDAQIHSSLGLAYQRSGRSAEAIGANRKAIALASGSNSGIIRANSYYNVGRIYEDADQLENAAENYRGAWRENNRNAVYYDALVRALKKQAARQQPGL